MLAKERDKTTEVNKTALKITLWGFEQNLVVKYSKKKLCGASDVLDWCKKRPQNKKQYKTLAWNQI